MRPGWLMVAVVPLAASCVTQVVPIETGISSQKTSYAVGERILIEGRATNATDRPVAYRASLKDLCVHELDESGARVFGRVFTAQPDGTEDTIVPGWPNEYFVLLVPGETKVIQKEFVAKRPGRYEAAFGIYSMTDMEQLPDPNYGRGSFPGQPAYRPVPWARQRRVPHAWVGTVPEKTLQFEVRGEGPAGEP